MILPQEREATEVDQFLILAKNGTLRAAHGKTFAATTPSKSIARPISNDRLSPALRRFQCRHTLVKCASPHLVQNEDW